MNDKTRFNVWIRVNEDSLSEHIKQLSAVSRDLWKDFQKGSVVEVDKIEQTSYGYRITHAGEWFDVSRREISFLSPLEALAMEAEQ